MDDFSYQATIEEAGTTYSDTFDYSEVNFNRGVEEYLNVTEVDGTNVTVDVTPQITFDGSNWIDETAFTQLTDVGSQLITNNDLGAQRRYKIAVAGDVVTSVTLSINAIAR